MISVCMAAYNGEKYIKKQLESILCQIGPDDEVIISDDGSHDNTVQIIASFADKRISMLNHEQQKIKNRKNARGYLCSQNFHNAIAHAKGDFVFLSDQDDIWMPNKVKYFLDILGKYDVVMSNFLIIDKDDEIINKDYFQRDPFNKNVMNSILTNPFFGCAMAFRRNILNKILPIPDGCVSYDLWIGCIAQKTAKIGYMDIPLLMYRRHGANVSYATSKSKNAVWFKIFWRIQFICLFCRRIINIYQNKIK